MFSPANRHPLRRNMRMPSSRAVADDAPRARRERPMRGMLAAGLSPHSEIVRTTLEVGRVLTVGSFCSLTSSSSYCAIVFSAPRALTCTTL